MPLELTVGIFDRETDILEAARAAKSASLPIYDAFTPFPVHGLDKAMGLAPSPLTKYCFRFGATGLLLTLGFQFWASTFDWPMNIGGKSFDASPALIPITFELTILFASIGTVLSFLRMRRLSPAAKPLLEGLGGVDDRFVLALRRGDGGAESAVLRRVLESHGAREVREIAA